MTTQEAVKRNEKAQNLRVWQVDDTWFYVWKKMIGKPYLEKLNVRFDEGELEIEPFGHCASSLLY